MLLTESARKLNGKFRELKDLCIESVSSDVFNDMSVKDFAVIKKCLSLLDESMTYMEEQAEAIDKINEKLDVLLEKSK